MSVRGLSSAEVLWDHVQSGFVRLSPLELRTPVGGQCRGADCQPLLTNVAAALRCHLCLCPPAGLEGVLQPCRESPRGLWCESCSPNSLLPVSGRNPVWPPLASSPAVPRAPHHHLISSCCGHNLFMDSPKQDNRSLQGVSEQGF